MRFCFLHVIVLSTKLDPLKSLVPILSRFDSGNSLLPALYSGNYDISSMGDKLLLHSSVKFPSSWSLVINYFHMHAKYVVVMATFSTAKNSRFVSIVCHRWY